jgi:hypothetical protein
MCEQEELAMKNENWRETMLRALYVLMVGAFCFCLGILAGCDGSGGGSDSGDAGAGKVLRTDAGWITCSIPSPTGDQPSGYGDEARDLPATNFLLVNNDVKKACEDTKTSYSSAAGIDCGDPAHDFQGTTGKPWCIVADSPEDPNLTSNCSANALSGSCVADGVAAMSKYTSGQAAGRYVRSIALCGMSGQFVGWMCTTT